MQITIEDLTNNLKTLPEEFYGEVNDFVELLKFKGSSAELKDWQKEILGQRIKNYQDNPSDTKGLSQVVAEMRAKYSKNGD